MKQKDRGLMVKNDKPQTCLVENGVHSCCDTFVRWYSDEVARLAARQSSSNIDAGEPPRLRFLEESGLWLEDGCVTTKRLAKVQWSCLCGK